ncbi:MAG: NACHT and WD repeat domain-containing protein [Pseudonocardiaceae bacterium]
MSRKRSPLPVEVLSFLLATLLGVSIGNLTSVAGPLPWGLELLRRQSLPLAGGTVVLMIGVMIWQRRTEERSARPLWDSDRSPFPGLEAFTERDSAVFFGRDAEIAELLDRLHPVVAGQANRLIAVVGPSGVGKSSLVQAGVVPRLRRRRSGWIVVPTVLPGDHPLRSLARSLGAAGSASDGTPALRFADEIRGAARHPNAPVLVIVDQAEELITLAGPAERDAFLGLLAGALDADSRLWIIMIMRSEFLTAFLSTAQARLFRDPVAVGTLGHAALVEVIQQPARRAGLSFDPPTLPQRMASEAGGGDALPLLAYALQELCLTARRGGALTADAYQRLGGVTGVLTRQADKVAAELGGADGLVLSTLLKFVTIGENEPTRRRVPRSVLTDAQWRIAEAFIAARLLISHTDGDDAILEVTHEALFRHWAPLQQAIEVSADQLRWRADIERWARDWDNSGHQDAYLLRDERLKAAQRWATSDGDVIDDLPLVAEFLTYSNQADHATMERLSETIARQALATVDSDPDYSLLLALAAYEEYGPTALALRALTAALVASQVRAVLRGHEDLVHGVAWSPDGRRLASGSSDRTVRIWDTHNRKELAVLHGHEDWVRWVAWAPDSQLLATASRDRTVRIWDIENGAEPLVLHGHNAEVWVVAWSPDGQRLATASDDRTARIWDAKTGSELTVLHDDEHWVRWVAWSPDGRRLATTTSNGRTARIWDINSGDELLVLRGHNGWVQAVVWSPDGERLATASEDRTVRIWEAVSGGELMVLSGHDEWVKRVAWSPDGRRLATTSNDSTARIWDADSGSELLVLRGHNGWVRGVAWSPDGKCLATASDDQTLRIWETRGTNELAVLYGHYSEVWGVTWSPDGARLATASTDGTARIWTADSGSELAVLNTHDDEVWGVAWSPDGGRLATASRDRTARIWDTENASQLRVLGGHDDQVWCVAWSPDGRRLATGSRDRTARIWDTEAATELAVLGGHEDWVRHVAWSPDGRQLATGSRDRTARIWDTNSGSELAALHGHSNWVRGVAWSPDGKRLATASRDRTVRIWDAQGGSEIARLYGHDDEVRGVAWSPDGRQLATGSADRTVRIWDAESGAEIIVVGAHSKAVDSVSWSPDGRRIASSSPDGTARVWDATISVNDLVADAHRRMSRELTAEERHNLMLPPIGD